MRLSISAFPVNPGTPERGLTGGYDRTGSRLGAIECFGACSFDAFVPVSYAYDAWRNDPHLKLLHRLLSGTADRSFRFEDLCALLERLGFVEHRHAGSHRIFIHADVAEILNLQPRSGGEAKPYQVRQVRGTVLKYGLAQSLSRSKGDAETEDEA